MSGKGKAKEESVGDDNQNGHNDDDDESSVSSEEELALEGELVRDPEASSSSSDSDDDNEDDDESSSNKKQSAAPKRKLEAATAAGASKKGTSDAKKTKKKKRKKDDDHEIANVEFIFCDMDEKYWHGCRALLNNSSTVYQRHASIWTDWLMEQVVGTVASTDSAAAPNDDENDGDPVFGFASLVAVNDTSVSAPDDDKKQQGAAKPKDDTQETIKERRQALQFLQEHAAAAAGGCPPQYKAEVLRLFDKEQKRPWFVFLHGRMMNLPLEIVLVLHQQLWLDWEWDQDDDADGKKKAKPRKKEKKKKKKKGKAGTEGDAAEDDSLSPRLLRLAPCTKAEGDILIYRYYDDELLAGQAEFSYTVPAPRAFSQEKPQFLQVMVLTPSGYQRAIRDLEQLVGGSGGGTSVAAG